MRFVQSGIVWGSRLCHRALSTNSAPCAHRHGGAQAIRVRPCREGKPALPSEQVRPGSLVRESGPVLHDYDGPEGDSSTIFCRMPRAVQKSTTSLLALSTRALRTITRRGFLIKLQHLRQAYVQAVPALNHFCTGLDV